MLEYNAANQNYLGVFIRSYSSAVSAQSPLHTHTDSFTIEVNASVNGPPVPLLGKSAELSATSELYATAIDSAAANEVLL